MRHPRAVTLAVAAVLLVPFVAVGLLVRDGVRDAVRVQFEQTLQNDLVARARLLDHTALEPSDLDDAALSDARRAELDGLFTDHVTRPSTHAVRLVATDGTIVHSTVPSEIGTSEPLEPEVLATSEPVALDEPHVHADHPDAIPLYELFVPLMTAGDGWLVIDECYMPAAAISTATTSRLDLAVGGALVALYLLTLPVVHRATARLRRHASEVEAALAEADAAHAVKDEFLEAVSHELRTPLTAIVGPVEMLRRSGDELPVDARRRLLDALQRSTTKLTRLITDLLDVDRARRAVHRAERDRTDVAHIIDRCVIELGDRGSGVVVDHGVHHAAIDATKFERIADNLVLNAVRHTPPGTRVQVRTRDRAGDLVLVVEDDGDGVPPHDRDRIFEAFERGSGHHYSPGTGVGLNVVRSFAQLHGGDARVDDSPMGGARFTVTFAQAECEPATARV